MVGHGETLPLSTMPQQDVVAEDMVSGPKETRVLIPVPPLATVEL